MIKYVATLVTVGSMVYLGLSLDTRSHRPPVRDAAPAVPETIFASGQVEGASEEIQLRPQFAGRVAELAVAEAAQVTAGDLLLRLDDREYQHAVTLAQADVRMAEARLARLVNGPRAEERREAEALWKSKAAELERARLQWNRVRQLRQQNAVTQQEADDQRMTVSALGSAVDAARARYELLEAPARDEDLQLAQAAIAAARAKLETAQLQLARTRLATPVDGQVVRIDTRVGELAGPQSAGPAVVVADTRRYRVRAFVDEFDAPGVRTGMPAAVTADGLPGRVFRGTVSQLSPRMDRKQHWTDAPDEQFDTKTREVWIDLEEADGLVLGLRVDVKIERG